ncbi:MAG: hypothetical protein ACHQVK_02425, partial [Candidatus Paceibacterales bacterium]
MNRLLMTVIVIFLFNFSFQSVFARQGEGQYRKGRGSINSGHSDFPKYSGKAKTPSRPDVLGNRVTEDHLGRVDFAHKRTDQMMKSDNRVTDVVRVNRVRFTNFYKPEFDHRAIVYNSFLTRYNAVVISHPLILDVWHRHYFFGGFYYGFHPVSDIDVYFYNPMVHWFYVGAYDEYYYRNWYKAEYDAYPELHRPFEYHGVYYPTENLRQLLFGVSAMPVEKQARFRTSVSFFTKSVAQKMANGLNTHVKLGSGDIAVTHYEIIGSDNAVVLEGVVTFQNNSYNFKGLLDLETPERSDAFVPASWDKNPTPEQLATLDGLNNRINVIKGDPGQSVSAE